VTTGRVCRRRRRPRWHGARRHGRGRCGPRCRGGSDYPFRCKCDVHHKTNDIQRDLGSRSHELTATGLRHSSVVACRAQEGRSRYRGSPREGPLPANDPREQDPGLSAPPHSTSARKIHLRTRHRCRAAAAVRGSTPATSRIHDGRSPRCANGRRRPRVVSHIKYRRIQRRFAGQAVRRSTASAPEALVESAPLGRHRCSRTTASAKIKIRRPTQRPGRDGGGLSEQLAAQCDLIRCTSAGGVTEAGRPFQGTSQVAVVPLRCADVAVRHARPPSGMCRCRRRRVGKSRSAHPILSR